MPEKHDPQTFRVCKQAAKESNLRPWGGRGFHNPEGTGPRFSRWRYSFTVTEIPERHELVATVPGSFGVSQPAREVSS